jgi:dTDP-4-dehydrorhamnose reductase
VLLQIARSVLEYEPAQRWGVYHLAGAGAVSWCGLAREIFRVSAALGGPSANVVPIATDEYPTLAKRPMNSRLDCGKAERAFGVALPDWRAGVRECVERLLAKP